MFANRAQSSLWIGAIAVFALASTGYAEKTHRVPDDFETINAALEEAVAGDTILVGPGVYKEALLLTEAKGDGIILKSTDGRANTSIAYPDEANVNEAVISFQRVSNSTQIVGFTIDGRGIAKRGILANSDSKPALQDLLIDGCEYGVASHRTSAPYLRDITIQNSRTSALFISGGSADVKDCRFTKSEKFGIYASSSTDEIKLRNVRITDSGQVGLQATDAEFAFTGGSVVNNGDSGIIVQYTSPTIRNVTIDTHTNVGIVLEESSARVSGCSILNNEYGSLVSISGDPTFTNCTFENNSTYHIGVEGEAGATIGGSLAAACKFIGEPEFALSTSSSGDVNATHNYWGFPCTPKKAFQRTGEGKLKRKPWAAPNLKREFEDCPAARKYHKKWENGKLDDDGNPANKQASAGGGADTAG